MSVYDAAGLARLRAVRMRFLMEGLTQECAVELLDELGFLGICDLVTLMAAAMEGSVECESERILVKIKRRPRVKKTKKTT